MLAKLIRLSLCGYPLGKGLLQRLLLKLCAHSVTREILVRLSPDMIKREVEGSVSGLATTNSQRLYGCQSNVVIVDPSYWMVKVSSDVTRTISLIFCLCINFFYC